MMKFYQIVRHVLIVGLLLTALDAWSQSTTVTGKVTAADDGTALPGVSIIEKGTTNGTVTDADGNYTITLKNANPVLVFSFVGFEPQEATVSSGQSSVNIVLASDVTALNEVVVVGYGTQTKREITGSIAKVTGEKITNIPTPSFEAALQGQAAGVQVIQGSGLAGAGSVIRVRGIASVSANGDPLYVVDGIPITADNFLQQANWQNGAFNNNPLSAINPNDIESIEVLKDASAAGIYGSRGSNGVILITTKRGKANAGKPVYNFSVNLGTSTPVAKPKFYNSAEWLQIRQEAWENDGNTGAVWVPGFSIASDDPETRMAAFQRASQNDTDWWDLLTQTGFKQQYNFSANVSKKKLSAYAGASYSDNETYIKGNAFKRYSLRANVDYKFSDQFDISLSSSYARGVNERVRVSYTGGLGEAMSTALPIYPVFNDDGSYFRQGANPVFAAANYSGFTVDDRTINTLALHYSPIEKLKFTVSGGYDYLNQKNDQWESGALRNDIRDLDGDDVNETPYNRAERDSREVNNFNLNLLAEYDFALSGSQKLKLLLGSEYQESTTSGANDEVYLGPGVDKTIFKNRGGFGSEAAETVKPVEVNDEKWSFLSYFLRANYSLKDRYYFQATARVDGSSRFGDNKRYGFFPVVSGAWFISEENFMTGVNAISSLKLKASFGIMGNANFENNQWIGTYEVGSTGTPYNGQPIRYPNKVENPDLQWETTQNFDAGFELGLFKNKVQAEVSYYSKNTADVIMRLTMPNYNGFGSFYGNVGKITNRGVEVTLNTINYQSGNFKWSSQFNFAYNLNNVKSIGGYTPDAVSGGTNDTRVVEGRPLGTNYLIRFSRVDPQTGKPIYLDVNGYETFEYNEQRDRVSVGNVLPDATGGFTNTFNYKNFELNFMFVYVIGGDIYDSSSKRQLGFLTDWNTRRDLGDRWRQPGDIAKYPRVTLTPSEHGNSKEWFNTDMWIHDASYVRLRSITLAYNFPSTMLERMKITNARLAFSGMNLLTFTRFQGLDSEVVRDFDNQTDRNLSPNITYLTPPQEKSYNVSLNITF